MIQKTFQHLLESIGRYVASSSLIGWFSLHSLPIGWSADWRWPGSPLVLVSQPAGTGARVAKIFHRDLRQNTANISLIHWSNQYISRVRRTSFETCSPLIENMIGNVFWKQIEWNIIQRISWLLSLCGTGRSRHCCQKNLIKPRSENFLTGKALRDQPD